MNVRTWIGREQIDEARIVSRTAHRAVVELRGAARAAPPCAPATENEEHPPSRRPEQFELTDIDTSLALPVGASVRVGRFAINESFAALTLFGCPLLGALLALGLWVYGFDGEARTGGGVAAGGIGLIVGLALAALINRALSHRVARVRLVPHHSDHRGG